jgi:hypothetical protein
MELSNTLKFLAEKFNSKKSSKNNVIFFPKDKHKNNDLVDLHDLVSPPIFENIDYNDHIHSYELLKNNAKFFDDVENDTWENSWQNNVWPNYRFANIKGLDESIYNSNKSLNKNFITMYMMAFNIKINNFKDITYDNFITLFIDKNVLSITNSFNKLYDSLYKSSLANNNKNKVFQYIIMRTIEKLSKEYLVFVKENNDAVNVPNNNNNTLIIDNMDKKDIITIIHSYNYFVVNNITMSTYEWFVTNVKLDHNIFVIAENMNIDIKNLTFNEVYSLITKILYYNLSMNNEQLNKFIIKILQIPYYLPSINNLDIITRINPIYPILFLNEKYNSLIYDQVLTDKLQLNNLFEKGLINLSLDTLYRYTNKFYIENYRKYLLNKYEDINLIDLLINNEENKNRQHSKLIDSINQYVTIFQEKDILEFKNYHNDYINNEKEFLDNANLKNIDIYINVVVPISENDEKSLFLINKQDIFNSHYILLLIRMLNFNSSNIDITRTNLLEKRLQKTIEYYDEPIFGNSDLLIINKNANVFIDQLFNLIHLFANFSDEDVKNYFGFIRLHKNIKDLDNKWIYIDNKFIYYTDNAKLKSNKVILHNIDYNNIEILYEEIISKMDIENFKHNVINNKFQYNISEIIINLIRNSKIPYLSLIYGKNYHLVLPTPQSLDFINSMYVENQSLNFLDNDSDFITYNKDEFFNYLDDWFIKLQKSLLAFIYYYSNYSLLNNWLNENTKNFICEISEYRDIKYNCFSISDISSNFDEKNKTLYKPTQPRSIFSFGEIRKINTLFKTTFTYKRISLALDELLSNNLNVDNKFKDILNVLFVNDKDLNTDNSFKKLFNKYFLLVHVIYQFLRLWGGPGKNYNNLKFSAWDNIDKENNINISLRLPIVIILIDMLDLIRNKIKEKIVLLIQDQVIDESYLLWENDLLLFNYIYNNSILDKLYMRKFGHIYNFNSFYGNLLAFSKYDYCMGVISGYSIYIIYTISFYLDLVSFIDKKDLFKMNEIEINKYTEQFNKDLTTNFDKFVNDNLHDLMKDVLNFIENRNYINSNDFIFNQQILKHYDIYKDNIDKLTIENYNVYTDINELRKLYDYVNESKIEYENENINKFKNFNEILDNYNKYINYKDTLSQLTIEVQNIQSNGDYLFTKGEIDKDDSNYILHKVNEYKKRIQKYEEDIYNIQVYFDNNNINNSAFEFLNVYFNTIESYNKALEKIKINIKILLMNKFYLQIEQVQLLNKSLKNKVIPIEAIDTNNYFKNYEPQNKNIIDSMLPFVYINNRDKVLNILKSNPNYYDNNIVKIINNLFDTFSNNKDIKKDFIATENEYFYNNLLGNPVYIDSWNSVENNVNYRVKVNSLRLFKTVESLGFQIKFDDIGDFEHQMNNNFNGIMGEINVIYANVYLMNVIKRYLTDNFQQKLIFNRNVSLNDYNQQVLHASIIQDEGIINDFNFTYSNSDFKYLKKYLTNY